jgi:hypothetical protein
VIDCEVGGANVEGMNFRAFQMLWLFLVCAGAGISSARGDSWAWPTIKTNVSESGAFEFVVHPGVSLNARKDRLPARGIFRQKTEGGVMQMWERPLVNRIAPVRVLIPDSGRYVVTMDEWHAVGTKPLVIYDAEGKLVADLALQDLNLANHPNITRSVSSYHWNEYAFVIFGPRNSETLTKSEAKRLEDMLFIRLHWGEIITIDLKTGAVRHREWWQLPPGEDQPLKIATKAFLDRTWEEAVQYFRAEEFAADPSWNGTRGLMLVAQLKRKEAIPLVRIIANTDRFEGWAAPPWDGKSTNLRDYARRALEEIEK